MIEDKSLFEEVVEYPDTVAQRRYAGLVGLDDLKSLLIKEAEILLNRKLLEDWSQKLHGQRLGLIDCFLGRSPLFVFAGDVGTGKTAFAETFPDAIARQMDVPAVLYALSLNARGTGAVGEMTTLISEAFSRVGAAARKSVSKNGRPACIHVLLVDEADALAQSRELSQMHHEDRAGVNALIRGIDDLTAKSLPVLVVMCTNRPEAIDPAVKRRAAGIFTFSRPTHEQCVQILAAALEGTAISKSQIQSLAHAMGKGKGRDYGYTFSDLTQRYLPTLVLEAYPHHKITYELAAVVLDRVEPTPPFSGESD